jgi:glycerol-3-phosphate acyltransferase PlsY
MIYAVLILLLAYVLGSIPTGYWVAKAAKGIDIRQFGSGSTGATNVWRCVGKPWLYGWIADQWLSSGDHWPLPIWYQLWWQDQL